VQVPAPAHHELGLAVLEVAAGGGAVRAPHGVHQVLEREVVRAQSAGVGEDVVLLLEAAEADDVGHARRAHQVLRHHPVLPAP
jgi:hypothetical protein